MAARADQACASLAVDSCELLGADNLAHGRWGSHDVTVRLPHAAVDSKGDRLTTGKVLPFKAVS